MSIIRKVFIPAIILLFFTSFKHGDDPLDRKVFNISLSETKGGVVAKKVITDKLTFKNGKLKSDFLYDKFGYKYIRYRINKDSIYTDFTDTEVRLLVVEAVFTDLNNQTVEMEFTNLEWDIDGGIRITKNDKLKRYYDFAGREKRGKPKKIKKAKDRIFEVLL